MDILTDKRFLVVFFITFFVYFLGSVASALRFAGIKTKLITTSFSLLNVITLISRLSNLFQTPFLGSMVDIAYKENNLDMLKLKIHLIIVASTLGAFFGVLFFTFFENLFIKWIEVFDRRKNLLYTFSYLFRFSTYVWIFRSMEAPKFYLSIENLRRSPLIVFISSVLIGSFWTTGVLSAIYASVLVPDFSRTATILSGIVNGIATILFTIFLDPTIANITDKVYNSQEKIEYLYNVIWVSLVGNILGTILAHLVFYPGAWIISYITLIFSKF
jgi:hypothetical protein